MEMRNNEKAKKRKAKEVKPIVEDCIRSGMDFSATKKELKKRNIHYPNLAKIFSTWQQAIFPEDERKNAIHSLSEKKKGKDEGLLSALTPRAWSKQKQKEVDESVIADVLNDAIFYFVPCPHKGLTIEDVKKINVGGSVTGLIVYYTDLNLNHPIIIFVLRTIMLVIKVKALCYAVQKKVEEVKGKLDMKIHHTQL